mmetsp:Transcript_14247/g.44849  ORF Transcript_14247/g.44849 Transcript_14247/m.44849 type:complete len:239 (-) Transcript_14247:322-1038(-)
MLVRFQIYVKNDIVVIIQFSIYLNEIMTVAILARVGWSVASAGSTTTIHPSLPTLNYSKQCTIIFEPTNSTLSSFIASLARAELAPLLLAFSLWLISFAPVPLPSPTLARSEALPRGVSPLHHNSDMSDILNGYEQRLTSSGHTWRASLGSRCCFVPCGLLRCPRCHASRAHRTCACTHTNVQLVSQCVSSRRPRSLARIQRRTRRRTRVPSGSTLASPSLATCSLLPSRWVPSFGLR